MASIVLTTVGQAVGAATGVPFAGQLGGFLGATIGAGLGGKKNNQTFEGARLETLAVQTSTYGRMIPIIFGTVRIAGNVIWSLPIKEVATTTTTTTGGGKGGGGSSTTTTTTSTTYSYYATLAVAVCEGEINEIERVWADSELLDLSQGTYRIYTGSETQMPDALIESIEGVGATPAYRGIAYIVMQDFPLADFGNRIPNFTFEVTRRLSQAGESEEPVESMVKSIMLIPGSGEFVYDPLTVSKIGGTNAAGMFIQNGYQTVLNQHTPAGKANVEVALDQLQQTFPNLEWVGLVVNWFGTSMNISDCQIWPCVEYQIEGITIPYDWEVAGYDRSTARQIGNDGGELRYGGTPDDGSIIRLLQSLRARGLKIFFYPQMLMDIEGKPWRGELTGSISDVNDFFDRSLGYKTFILHYASMVNGLVDAFAIGTEMRDLTSITDGAGSFPVVDQMVALAGTVKSILGPAVAITYAADWSEYHHTDGGWYHLDPLWACSAIDMVGIDAYFPLTDAVQTGYDVDAIRAGWTSGEGYDFYYTDTDRTIKADLSPPYAWKNIAWWWSNPHVNPDGITTSWVPNSKPIWFTEYGYASVDGSTNEPNVFIDNSTAGSAYPRFSKGLVDFMAQRTAITAAQLEWAESSMVNRLFLWTWDARPYPYWPDLLNVWSDGNNWVTGHWVQGKLGSSQVGAAVQELMLRAGLSSSQIDAQQVQAILDGFVLNNRVTVRAAINQLMQAYFFTIKESDSKLVLIPLDASVDCEVQASDCVPNTVAKQSVAYVLERKEDLVLPQLLEVQFLNRLQSYETDVQSASRSTQQATDIVSIALSLVLSEAHARAIAETELTTQWAERSSVTLQLPMRYAALEPGDLLQLDDGATSYRIRLNKVQIGKPGIVRLSGVIDASDVNNYYIAPVSGGDASQVKPIPLTHLEILDIPAFPSDAQDALTIRFAACGLADGWTGATITQLLASGNEQGLLNISVPAIMGSTVTILGVAPATAFDLENTIDVALLGTATLTSTTQTSVLNGSNVAIIGNEIIQFTQATQISPNLYRLSHLLRGRLGTEAFIAGHVVGERFVFINEAVVACVLPASNNGQTLHLRATTYGAALNTGTTSSIAIQANSLKPYSPVQIQAIRIPTGDVTILWKRRARIDGGLRDYIDIPLMEATELYDLKLYDGSLLKRSWRVSAPEVIYAWADQLTDFSEAPATLTLQIAQISALVGLGNVTAETVLIQE